jgi:alanyl-tRNA synthetase
MTAAEIRQRFLEYFERNGHQIRSSSSLVPADDPTLLFVNAGMVQFKRVFLGEEDLGIRRATTSQKCLRVSGKHNDLEEVGRTARHHTFFEMLGNFSFGDYFKRDAIRFAWEFMTEELGLDKKKLYATVHYTDDEAAELWEEIAGLPRSRIYRLGDKDNFWQMGDTGPCGPCSELHYDLRKEGAGTDLPEDEFVERGEAGEFLELWNLVFMQFDRSADGEMTPLPRPSIDTGAGLERIASVLQGVRSNYETDLFRSLIDRAVEVVGVEYDPGEGGVSYRVLADHARAVAFLLADGVFPTNEGRGYVLRRILRRAVRHAWLLGRREPTLVEVVDEVITRMGGVYPELVQRREHLLRATRMEEERFLSTIDAGMDRFDALAPAGGESGQVIAGEDAFRLYDTFGFPLDLTQLMAEERGYQVDTDGFEEALEAQRERSRKDRAQSEHEVSDSLAQGWEELEAGAEQEFVGYETTLAETDVTAFRREDGRVALELRRNPFYVESGGQISDAGTVEGDGWRMVVDDVRKVAGRVAVIGDVEGEFPETDRPFQVRAEVTQPRRHDTERNHTATHLLHAALRNVLGQHVVQRGSLVAPDRLRFDFSHPQPMTADEIRAVEEQVNRAILDDHAVRIRFMPYDDAIEKGAMALFGEKYGDVVRTITVPGVSMELCGGTHLRHTGEIGMFRIVSETGVGAGVRRIEAVTGPEAFRRTIQQEDTLLQAAALVKTPPDMLVHRIQQLVEENHELERQLRQVRREGAADLVSDLVDAAAAVDGARVVAQEVSVATQDELRALGDRLRERLGSGAVVLAASYDDKTSLFAVVTDDLIGRGVRADELLRKVAKLTGGSGGGRPHMAQGGVGDPSRVSDALAQAPAIVQELLGKAG